jgi:hypothetical protein
MAERVNDGNRSHCFLDAQDEIYDQVIEELTIGRKRTRHLLRPAMTFNPTSAKARAISQYSPQSAAPQGEKQTVGTGVVRGEAIRRPP